MKNSAKFIVVCGLALSVAALSFAQAAGPAGGAPAHTGAQAGQKGNRAAFEKKLEQIQDAALVKAGASSDQIKQVKALRKKEAADRKAMMEKFKPAPGTPPPAAGERPKPSPEQQAARKKMRADNEAAMKGILGSKYDAYVAAMKASMQQMGGQFGGRGGRGGGGAPGAGGGAGAGAGGGGGAN